MEEDGKSSKHSHKTHDPQIQTVTLTAHAPLQLDRVKSFLDKLLWDRESQQEDVYRWSCTPVPAACTQHCQCARSCPPACALLSRAKGVLHIQGEERKQMLQVGPHFCCLTTACKAPHGGGAACAGCV
jgi:G3E family GTPase